LRGDQGARSVVQRHGPPHRLTSEDIGCVFDVDTPDKLASARARLDQHPPKPV
jgi:CTP:molybdopterin cytidylyltransferase MocA